MLQIKMGSDILDLVAVTEYIPISEIHVSKFPIRESTNLNELVESIRQHGLIQPIVVRIIENGYEVIAGHRRLEACKRLRWRQIPCLILDLEDRDSYEVQLIENLQREALNPIQEADCYYQYVKNYGWGGITYLAKRIGKSQEYISNRLQLLKLPKEIKEEIIRRRISPSSGLEILTVTNDKDRMKFMKLITEKNLSVKKIREVVGLIKEDTNIETAVAIVNDAPEFMKFDKLNQMNKDQLLNILKRSIIALRMALFRIDHIMKGCDDLELTKDQKWNQLEEMLMYQRRMIHDLIDKSVSMKMELQRKKKGVHDAI